MISMKGILSRIITLCVAVGVIFAATSNALADKLYLKDGRVLEGTVTSETPDYIYFKMKVGGIEHSDIYAMSDIKKIERDSVTNPTPSTGNSSATAPIASGKKPNGNVQRLCILDFGPPSYWSAEAGNEVGVQISAAAFERAIPILERDGVDVVIIRINSGGGYSLEMRNFHKVFAKYKEKFRTVAWIESAISAACMSPWILEEFYFMPKGNMGACTEWSGPLIATKGAALEIVLKYMEDISKKANRDPKIMRAMEIMEPLSATIDPVTGQVKWFQDTSGDKVLNPPGQILTMNAEDAVKYKLARAICATKEELAEAILGKGVEYEWASKEASDMIDQSIRTNDKAEKDAIEIAVKYSLALQLAESAQTPEERAAQVGRAKRFLLQLESWVKQNPNLEFHLANQVGALLDREWFEVQKEHLKDLLR